MHIEKYQCMIKIVKTNSMSMTNSRKFCKIGSRGLGITHRGQPHEKKNLELGEIYFRGKKIIKFLRQNWSLNMDNFSGKSLYL